ncbi:MAG: hypothetical protein WBJ68_10050 [Candidatus Dechloromonas phosphoritropha]|jgi:hypothetical protein
MPTIRHEEIVEKFLGSESVNFNALGKFVAENGALIAASSRGDYGVRFGHYNILACFNIGPIDPRLGQFGSRSAGIASEVTGAG